MNEPSKETTPAENPVYRRVFVGREAELRQLQAAFDGAAAGQGALTMVMGEPGIGKTALCDKLTAYTNLHGGRTLAGYCYEEGSRSLPYLAFVEALSPYILSREAEHLRQELGAGAADAARILPQISQRLGIKPRQQKDPEEERYRLLQAITAFLTNIAAVQPLLVVLEDLHDADKGTLDMLLHVSRHLAGTRILIMGTYRDVEVDRSHPLSAALAELRRVSGYDRVLLRGLNPDGVRRMLESITGETIPFGLAGAVHRQTEGNPLFVQEAIRYLAEAGLLSQRGERRTGKDIPLEMSIPEGLRDVVGKRLSRLSPECNRALSVAAVIGREFRLDLLQKVGGLQDDELANALEEARKADVVEGRSTVAGGVLYRFAHAFFRQTLYEEMIPPLRLKLHQQVARALETLYPGQLEEHAAELAEHFSQSTDPADLAKAVSYGEMAGRSATDVFACGEAVRLLERALQVQRVLDPSNKAKQCDLLLALCEVLFLASEPRRILDTEAPVAFSLAEAIGDSGRISRVCNLAAYALILVASLPIFATAEAIKWTERADRYAKADTVERVMADICLGMVQCAQVRPAHGVPLLTRALDLARRLGDPDAFWKASTTWLAFVTAPQHAKERLRLAEELAGASRSGVGRIGITSGLQMMFHAFLESGQRLRAENALNEYRAIAERASQDSLRIYLLQCDATMAAIDGRLEEAVEICHSLRSRFVGRDYSQTASTSAGFAGMWPLLHIGKAGEALGWLTGFLSPAARSLCLAQLGRNDEVNEILDRLVLQRPGIGTVRDETASYNDALYLAAAVAVGNRRAAELLLKRFASIKGATTTGIRFTTCIARHLGDGAALVGKYDEARQHYQEAIKVCTDMRFRPELALTRLHLAELLLEHYPDEKKAALEHLNFAIKEFREMKMQPSLERAQSIMAGRAVTAKMTPANALSESISERELEVLRLMAEGLSNQQIADKLTISLNTAKTHVSHLFNKLNAKDRLQAVTRARELKLI